MLTALELPRTWAPRWSNTLRVVLTTVVVVLVLTALLVATAGVVQTLAGGAPLPPITPGAGLDL